MSGRPKKPVCRDKVTRVRLTDEELKRLDNFCRTTQQSKSEVIRAALEMYLDMGIDIYECDPDKNKTCKKTGCYKDGGPCHCTTVKEFAKDLETENYRYV